MKMLLRALALVAAMSFAGHALAQITLFEHDDFRGRRVSVEDPIPDLGVPQLSFGERASSASVRGGTWQVCTEVAYRGRCVTLSPGDYRSFASMGMNDRAVSARPIGSGGRVPPVAQARRGRLVLYDYTNFTGRSVVVDGDVLDFSSIRFNDAVVSVIVESGTWVLCEHAEFRGQCITLRPGRYIDLADMNRRISSARMVDGGGGPVAAPAVPPPAPAGRGVVLFTLANLQGMSVPIDRPIVRNFEEIGMNDRPLSMRVEQGYWMFCSDANFEGECRTFGPGEYPSLPPELDRRISSARRISNEYPYTEPPRWR